MDFHFPSFMFGLVAVSGLFTIVKWFRGPQKNPDSVKPYKTHCFLFNPLKYSIKCLRNTITCDQLACPVCNFKDYIETIQETKSHLDICMFFITYEAITNVVLNLFKKGVFVRVIVDKQMVDDINNSKFLFFVENYIPIKIIKHCEIMHNKFLIIDKKRVLTGSFNWTKRAMHENFENIMVCDDLEIVRKYEMYFENIWFLPEV